MTEKVKSLKNLFYAGKNNDFFKDYSAGYRFLFFQLFLLNFFL